MLHGFKKAELIGLWYAGKRTCGVKDSGHWIPGMGGAFDVLDSFIYNGVIFWILCLFRF